jgi:NAD-dependent dihydropyrimidine dehydrogenase PreA subunit
LGATGIERSAIESATGFRARWGPARLEDLPAYLDRGHAERTMRFPRWERLEMSSVWSVPMTMITGVVVGLLTSWPIGLATAVAILTSITLLFTILRHVPVQGPRRWLTYVTLWVVQGGSVLALLAATGGWSTRAATVVAVATLAEVLMLSLDVAGTTPWYASTINTFRNPHRIELDEAACTGAAQCVLVCPSDVLKMDGERRKVVLESPDACVLCGACIVQCPEDALFFRYPDGSLVPPDTVRRTRLNMLGRRTIELRPPGGPDR